MARLRRELDEATGALERAQAELKAHEHDVEAKRREGEVATRLTARLQRDRASAEDVGAAMQLADSLRRTAAAAAAALPRLRAAAATAACDVEVAEARCGVAKAEGMLWWLRRKRDDAAAGLPGGWAPRVAEAAYDEQLRVCKAAQGRLAAAEEQAGQRAA